MKNRDRKRRSEIPGTAYAFRAAALSSDVFCAKFYAFGDFAPSFFEKTLHLCNNMFLEYIAKYAKGNIWVK
jgi:hypothetical protein